MPRECIICGKGARTGNSIVMRGMAKKKGGIGLHTTGINRRRFLPNLQKIRILLNGRKVRASVCATCIKAGKVTKA